MFLERYENTKKVSLLSLKPPYIAMATEPSAPLNMPDKCNLKAPRKSLLTSSSLLPAFLHPLILHPPFTHNEISYTLSLPFSLASFTAVRLSLPCLCLSLSLRASASSHPLPPPPHPFCAFSSSPSLPFSTHSSPAPAFIIGLKRHTQTLCNISLSHRGRGP